MSDKPWFANRGQMMQTASALVSAICAFLGLLIGLYINLPDLFQKSISGASAILSIAVIPVLTGVLGNFIFARMTKSSGDAVTKKSTAPAMEMVAPNTAPPAERPDRPKPIDFMAPLPPKTEFEILEMRIKVGSYWEKSSGLDRYRISALGIVGEPGKQRADLKVGTGGSLFHPGSQVEETSVNRFLVPETRDGFQAEERCVYQFSFSDTHVHFRAVRVHGIDLHCQEVAVSMVLLRYMAVPALVTR